MGVALRVELLVFYIERSLLRWFRHPTMMPPGQGIPGISYQKVDGAQTQDMLGRLNCSAWLGISRCPPRRGRSGGRGEGNL